MGTHEDIEEKHRTPMRYIAEVLDDFFNGTMRPKKVGFGLFVFDFDGERINYVSNAARPEMICAMKEWIARAEGRHIEETSPPIPTEAQ